MLGNPLSTAIISSATLERTIGALKMFLRNDSESNTVISRLFNITDNNEVSNSIKKKQLQNNLF